MSDTLTQAVEREVIALGLSADPNGQAAIEQARHVDEMTAEDVGLGVRAHAVRSLDLNLRALQVAIPPAGFTDALREAIAERCRVAARLARTPSTAPASW